MSTSLTVCYSDEAQRWGADPYAAMISAHKERQERLRLAAIREQQARLRQEEERAATYALARKIATRRPPLIVWEVAPKPVPRSPSAVDYSIDTRGAVEKIIQHVAQRYHVTRMDLVSARRTGGVIRPRHIAIYLAKILTPLSLPSIGRLFGKRDHTTILHAIRKMSWLVETAPGIRDEVERLRAEIEAMIRPSERKCVVEAAEHAVA